MNLSKRTIEYFIYFLFWGILFLSPFWGDFQSGDSLEWSEVYSAWVGLLPALALFFINNNLLMPFLLYKKRKRRYILFLICAITFVYFASWFVPMPVRDIPQPPRFEQFHNGDHLPLPPPSVVDPIAGAMHADSLSEFSDSGNAERPLFFPPDMNIAENELPPHFLHPDAVHVFLIVFVLVFNICVRLFFFTVRSDEYLMEVEKQRLSTELKYLKYQINPHFFMNTLNNIHALIDIDKGKAQASVIELSKMMRHILYDASASYVPLAKEVEFLTSYIGLMRMRYSNKLNINISFPSECASCDVPSLLFVSFIENAFKHGALHNKGAFVNVALAVEDGNIKFSCANNCMPATPGTTNAGTVHRGIGIDNIHKRLSLLYGNSYSLDILREEYLFSVTLKIPLNNDKVYNS